MNRFDTFIAGMERLVGAGLPQPALLAQAEPLLRDLIAHDDWLPERFAAPGQDTYRQYLLHCDARQRFSVVSLVWGPGQQTPVHDHTVWGLVGVLRGRERCTEYALDAAGHARASGDVHELAAGEVEVLTPGDNDVHVVRNALDDAVSVSIHVYGADIGAIKRHWYDAQTGEPREFVSGYSEAA